MNDTTLERPDVAAYLAAVRSALADVPADERDELLADVEASLLESDGETLTRPPEAFAAELREAAGLEPSENAPRRLRALWNRARAVGGDARVRELAPIWWVARAYVAAAFFSLATTGLQPLGSSSPQTGSVDTSILLLIVATPASIWLGFRVRRGSEALHRAVLVGNVVLVLALVPVVSNSLYALGSNTFYTVAEPTPGLALDGVPIGNVYPYSRDGKLLLDVLLYTDLGVPVDLLTAADDIDRRVLDTANGLRLYNSFPIRYFDPGTRNVGRPTLGPAVTIPEVTTPELQQP